MTQQLNDTQTIEQLSSHIVQFLNLLKRFHNALLSEAAALKSNQTDQLSDAASLKNTLSNDLSQKTHTINTLLKTQNLTLETLFSPDNFNALPAPLNETIPQVLELTQACHDLNQSNGISIQVLSNINQYTLNLLSGKEQENINLYGSSGEQQASQKSKRTLGKA